MFFFNIQENDTTFINGINEDEAESSMLLRTLAPSMAQDNEVDFSAMGQSSSKLQEPFSNRVLNEISTSSESNVLKMPLQKLNIEVGSFNAYKNVLHYISSLADA